MALLGLLAALAAPAFAAEATELVVRIDDQRVRNLAQPWVVLVNPDGATHAVMALDDGSDPADAFAGDHLWIARVRLDEPLPTELVVRDGAPAPMAPLVKRTPLRLLAGQRNDVQVRVREAVGSPAAAPRTPGEGGLAGDAAPSPDAGGGASGGPDEAAGAPTEGPRPEIDDEALIASTPFEVVPWPRWLLVAWAMPLLLGAAARGVLPRIARLLESRLAGSVLRIEALALPLPRAGAAADIPEEGSGAAGGDSGEMRPPRWDRGFA